MVSPKTKRKATKKGKGTPGRRNGRSASSSPTKKKQNKTTKSATKGGMDIDAIAGANGAEAAAAAKADNENVGGKPPDETTTSKEKDKEDDDTPKDQDVEAATKDNEDEKTTKDNGDEKTTKDNGDEETTTGTEDVGTTKGIEDAAVLPPSKVSPHVGDVQDPLAPPFLGQQSQDSYAHRASMDTDSDSDIDLSAIVDSSRKEKRDARKEQARRTAEAKAARQGVPSMVPVEEIDEEIFVTGPDGEEAAIEVVGPSAAREVLGVFQAADSNMAEQMKELKAKVDAWTANLENGFLHRRSVWRAFLLTIWKSIEYVLPAIRRAEDRSPDLYNNVDGVALGERRA